MFISESTMADAETLEFASDIAHEAKKRLGFEIEKVSISVDVRPKTPSSDTRWCILIAWYDRLGAYQTEVASEMELHDAANALIKKLPQPPDLAAILGYDEVRPCP